MLADRLTEEVQVAGRLHAWALWGIVLVAIGFVFFVTGTVLAATTGSVNPIVPIMIGFALVAVGGFMVGIAGPPPIPGRRRGPPVPRPCPRCGAMPLALSAHGLARCSHCGERFFVE